MDKPYPEGSTYVCATWGYVMQKHHGKWVRQHRLLMEQHLGRSLLKNEVVHHKNGVRSDNRLDNLEVKDDAEHRSQHSRERRHSEETKQKMSNSAKRVAALPGESERRSQQAKDQWDAGNLGRLAKRS